MPGILDGKVAMVTGAAQGIGEATCRTLAAAGAMVMAVDVNAETGKVAAETMSADGFSVAFVQADVSKEADVHAAVQETVKLFGRLDLAHNNAGIDQFERSGVTDIDEAYWDRILSVNLKGVFLGMKHQIPEMLKVGGGAIVNTSSGAGVKGVPGIGAYVASKHGIVGLTKTTALDYGTQNIRVNAICPGAVMTSISTTIAQGDPELAEAYRKMNAMERFGDPEEIANAVLWLLSPAASYATGMIMTIDGGFAAR